MTAIEMKRIRTTLGLTQDELAAELEISVRTIRRWEQDQWPIPKLAASYLRLLREGAAQKNRGEYAGNCVANA